MTVMLDEISFDERGLVPVVVQDEASAEVLMLAWANAKALELTQETGEMHFFSRSRDEIWRKGETSGMTMAVKQLRYDCDGDAVLAIVTPAGPACHTGERTCFYRELGGEPRRVVHEALPSLERTLKSRAAERPEGSYTVELLDNPTLIGEKVEEEDAVLLAARGVPQSAVFEELNERAG